MSQEPVSIRECPFCLGEVAQLATRCRHCAADFASVSKHVDIAGFFVAGVLLSIFGGVLIASGGDGQGWGIVVGILGAVFLQIAVIASGVSIGMRNRDEQTRVNRYVGAKVDED